MIPSDQNRAVARCRTSRARKSARAARADAGVPGLRLIDDILVTGIDDYYELWQKAEIGQLDREMALQAYLLARAMAPSFLAI